MKWMVLAVFIVLVPMLASWMRSRPSSAPLFWGLLGFLPFVIGGLKLDIAPISWGLWQGYSKGILISLLDVIALAVLVASPRTKGLPPFMLLWVFFAFTAFLSMFQSELPEAALFAVWDTCRVTLIFVASAFICRQDRGPRTLLAGMSLGLAVNAGFSIYQWLTGEPRPHGLYIHQNLLGMASHFVAFPALAMLLGGSRSKIFALGVASAMIVAILGASRGTIGLAGAGYGMLLLLSLLRNLTMRKLGVVAVGILGLAIASPLAISSLDRRFENTEQTLGDYDERAAFETAAKAILTDHPLGIGANQYVLIANKQGYLEKSGVAWNSGSRGALVHNAYLLQSSETGYIGLLSIILLLFVPIFSAIKLTYFSKKYYQSELLLGCAVSLIIVSIHNLFEWVFMTYSIQVLLAILISIISSRIRK